MYPTLQNHGQKSGFKSSLEDSTYDLRVISVETKCLLNNLIFPFLLSFSAKDGKLFLTPV